MFTKKINRLLLTALFLAVFASLGRSELTQEPKTLEEAGVWMMHYYEKPQAQYILPSLKLILTDDAFIADDVHNLPVMRFFIVVTKDNPAVFESLKQLRDSLAGNKRDYVSKIIEQAQSFKPIEYPNDAQDLDFLWSEFFATGSEEPVIKVVKTFSYTPGELDLDAPNWRKMEGLPSREMALKILQAAAKWSLVSNAAQHKRVHDIIESEVKTTKDANIKKALSGILADADRAKAPKPSEQ